MYQQSAAPIVVVLSAHFFVFYFGIIADITPPVALAAFAASGISGGDPIRTGIHSAKLSNCCIYYSVYDCSSHQRY